MIIVRTFSNINMLDKIVEKLDKERIEDYDVVSKIPSDSFSITMDSLSDIKIYIPRSEEYSQYELDDYIRKEIPFTRTSTVFDRNIYVMKLSKPITETQLYNLIKHIIEDYEFCALIDKKIN